MTGGSDEANGRAIEAEIAWFERRLDDRLRGFFRQEGAGGEHEPPALSSSAVYHQALQAAGLDPAERLIAFLALLPFVRPRSLDPLLIRNQTLDRPFTEFGGTGSPSPGFRPTRETALFLLAGEDMAARVAAQRLFRGDARLTARNVLARQADDLSPDLPLVPKPGWVASALGL